MTTIAPAQHSGDTGGTGPTGSLFAPTTVAGLALRNSFVMAPMTRSQSPAGVPTAENAAYYRRRAAGGIGLIVTEGVYVDHVSAGYETSIPRLVPDAAAGWKTVVDAVHAEGSAIFAQLWHLGSERQSPDGRPAWTPSGVDEHGRANSHAMTLADLETIVAAFARSGRLAWELGFDGVELHGAHGYLLDEFLWSATNRRTDAYGGSHRNRARFVAEVIAAVRAATSPDFPIAVRFSQFKEREYGARLADDVTGLDELLQPLVDAGASMFHASTRRFWQPEFEGSTLNLAGWTKRLTGLPVVTVGSLGLTGPSLGGGPDQPQSLAALTARHAAGEFDLVALGRTLLANPDWVRTAQEQRWDQLTDYRKAHEDVYW